MKTRILLITAALLTMSTALVAQDVSYNFDQAANFSKYKTYKWVDIKDAMKLDQIMDKQVRDAIDTQLSTKGLRKVDGETADLLIGYQAAIGQEKQINSYNMGGGAWGYGGRYGYGGGGMTTATTSTINIGQVVVDMYDPAAKQLVWRGRVSKTIDEKAKPDKRQKNIEKAAAKLMKNYPPQVKK